MIANPEMQLCQTILSHHASKEASLLEENFCRPGNSPIHLSFYNGDTVINFQLKYLLRRSNRKGRKWVWKLSNEISVSKSAFKFPKMKKACTTFSGTWQSS